MLGPSQTTPGSSTSPPHIRRGPSGWLDMIHAEGRPHPIPPVFEVGRGWNSHLHASTTARLGYAHRPPHHLGSNATCWPNRGNHRPHPLILRPQGVLGTTHIPVLTEEATAPPPKDISGPYIQVSSPGTRHENMALQSGDGFSNRHTPSVGHGPHVARLFVS